MNIQLISRTAGTALLVLSIAACTATPITDQSRPGVTSPAEQPTELPTAAPTTPTATPPAEQPTESPTAAPTAPGPPPTPGPTAPAEQTATPGNGEGDGTTIAGTWVGTVTGSTGSQGLRLRLRDLGGQISGTAQWEHGRIHTGLRGTLEGDTLTLVNTLTTGNLITTFEGTVSGSTYTGTVVDMFGDMPAPAGPSTFELTREE